MAGRAALYCRISDDKRGHALGVTRQREDCVALAAARGWDVQHVYVDNDISAYSGKPRPGYQQLMAALRSQQVDVVVAWHPDRLHRAPIELEDFITVVEQSGAHVETVQAGRYDLSTPSGRFIARNIGAAARYESEHKSERVRRALEQIATTGRSHGATAYGWRRTYRPDGTFVEELDPEQAATVRDIATRILRGESIRSITTALNDAGVPSPRGKQWGKNMVRHVVLRERNAGHRVHHGQIIGAGDWPLILDVSTFDQLRAVLSDPARRTSQSSASVHLLSGIATCGVCGGTMRAGLNRGNPSYRCSAKSCVSRRRDDVDDLVQDVVLARLARPDAAHLLRPDTSEARQRSQAEAAALRARLDTAADEYADGKIDARQLERITARIRPALEAATIAARSVDDSPVLHGLVANPDVEAAWETLPLSRRRAVISRLLTVHIDRARTGQRTFDPASVRLSWRSS